MVFKKFLLLIALVLFVISFGCVEEDSNGSGKDNNLSLDTNQPIIDSVDVLREREFQQKYVENIITFESQRFSIIDELNEKFGSTDNLSYDSIVVYLEKYGVGFCSVLENQENKSFCENYYPTLAINEGKPDKYLCEYVTSQVERQECIDKMIVLANTINYFKLYPSDVNSAWNKIELPLKEFDFSNCVLVSEENNKYCINPLNAVKDKVFGIKYNFFRWVEYE